MEFLRVPRDVGLGASVPWHASCGHPGPARGAGMNLGQPRPPPSPVFMAQATFPSGFEVVLLQDGGEAAVGRFFPS